MKTKHTQKHRLFSLLWIGLLLTGFAALLHSCYPGDPLSVTDTDLVTTFRDANANFADKQSYAIPDSVVYIEDNGFTINRGPNDVVILSAIGRNMQAMGYTETDTSNADVILVALTTTSEWKGGGCYPSWWCSWYYCYPGWCYPVTYTYTTGSVIILMLDRNQAGGTDNVTPLWIAGLNGLLSSGVDTAARINRNIDQAFTQSSYLKEGK